MNVMQTYTNASVQSPMISTILSIQEISYQRAVKQTSLSIHDELTVRRRRTYECLFKVSSTSGSGLPCTPHEKIGSQDYNQLLDDLHEMLRSLCESRQHGTVLEWMPMFCTLDSFWSTKAALDWLYEQPSTRDRLDDYTLYPIEALVAVIYENFYQRAEFKCDLRVLMGFRIAVLRSTHGRFSRLLGRHRNSRYCILVRVTIMPSSTTNIVQWPMWVNRCLDLLHSSAFRFVIWQNITPRWWPTCSTPTVIRIHRLFCRTSKPRIKAIYRFNKKSFGQAERNDRYWRIVNAISDWMHPFHRTMWARMVSPLKTPEWRNTILVERLFSVNISSFFAPARHDSLFLGHKHHSNLNPLAVPFSAQRDRDQGVSSSTNNDKIPAQLVLFEPRTTSSGRPSCQTTHQRMHHRPQEDWDWSMESRNCLFVVFSTDERESAHQHLISVRKENN